MAFDRFVSWLQFLGFKNLVLIDLVQEKVAVLISSKEGVLALGRGINFEDGFNRRRISVLGCLMVLNTGNGYSAKVNLLQVLVLLREFSQAYRDRKLVLATEVWV